MRLIFHAKKTDTNPNPYHHIYVNGNMYMYKINNKKIKNITIKQLPNNNFLVSANLKIHCPQLIEQFVTQVISRTKHIIDVVDLKNQTLIINNQTIKYVILNNNVKKNKYEFINNIYYIHAKDQDAVSTIIEKIYIDLALPVITKIINEYERLMGVKTNKLILKWRWSKWGHCENKANNILINPAVMSFAYDVQKYLVIHELSHIIHHNHSNSFWQCVEKYCPNYSQLDKTLHSRRLNFDN